MKYLMNSVDQNISNHEFIVFSKINNIDQNFIIKKLFKF